MRATLLAGVAVAALAAPALGQPSQDALDGLFLNLRQLQDANLGIARQMSDIQRRAAAVLVAAQSEGEIGDPAQQEIVTAFISNALTLASVVLAPVATQDVAAGDVFAGLLEDNMALVVRSEPLFRGNPGLAEAMEQYAVMQVQTQDLGLALRNGWNRYGQAVANAEAAGLLPAGAFDPEAKNWTIQLPEVDVAALAPVPGDSGAAASENEQRLAPQTSALDPLTLEPNAEMAAAAEKEAERLAETTPKTETVDAPEPDPQAETAIADVAPEPVAGEAAPEPQAQPVTQPAAWMVMIGDNARAVATAPNANAATADRIKGLQIGCHPNGTLRYVFESDGDIGEYLVYANDEQSAKIQANGNVVSGTDAIQMSDMLRLAFEWANGSADPGAHIMVAAGDDPDALAYFPVSGYLEARGRVLDGCLPWEDQEREVQPASDAALEEVVTTEPAAPSEAETSEGTAPAPASVAPVPRPRPASRMPVDLMNAG